MLGAILLTAALARAEPLVWTWEAPRTWAVQTQLVLPQPLWLPAERNLQVRVSEVQLSLVTRCAPATTYKRRGWLLRCDVLDAGIRGRPYQGDEGLSEILDEYDARLLGGWVEVDLSPDGRIRSIDLRGLDDGQRRVREGNEVLRLLVVRALAPLDLRLPPKGALPEGGAWREDGALPLGFVSQAGTMGRLTLTHRATGEGVVEILSEGEGIIGPGDTVVVNGVERPRNLFDARFSGSAHFGQGAVLDRAYLMEAAPTASSELADGGAGQRYLQATELTLVPEGASVAPISANGSIEGAADAE
ncbi:MAG: hypothetical protein JXX28_05015 [Deltaproteobacteria bacterium]|nr:hypothetical protein [Deltaproteobacteria bacterium]